MLKLTAKVRFYHLLFRLIMVGVLSKIIYDYLTLFDIRFTSARSGIDSFTTLLAVAFFTVLLIIFCHSLLLCYRRRNDVVVLKLEDRGSFIRLAVYKNGHRIKDSVIPIGNIYIYRCHLITDVGERALRLNCHSLLAGHFVKQIVALRDYSDYFSIHDLYRIRRFLQSYIETHQQKYGVIEKGMPEFSHKVAVDLLTSPDKTHCSANTVAGNLAKTCFEQTLLCQSLRDPLNQVRVYRYLCPAGVFRAAFIDRRGVLSSVILDYEKSCQHTIEQQVLAGVERYDVL